VEDLADVANFYTLFHHTQYPSYGATKSYVMAYQPTDSDRSIIIDNY
jgi:hypothetical protein